MVKLAVFETVGSEEALFLRLVSRGQCADIPYYYSVESHNWEEGWVLFSRLDCEPSPRFRVGVAGNLLVSSVKYAALMESWLREWSIGFYRLPEVVMQDSNEARAYLQKLRSDESRCRGRAKMGERVRLQIANFEEANDRALQAMPS